MPHTISPPSLSQKAQSFILGRYQHYKGDYYQALYIARIEETHEECVVYKAEYGDEFIWIRPLEIFTEIVTYQGKQQPRFQLITK